jgi:CBS domain-containing protein
MKIRDVMTGSCEFIHPEAPVLEAARRMNELECGFLPIGDKSNGKLQGVVTDRDIVVRAVAAGVDPAQMRISDCATPKVLYCYENDEVDTAARHMGKLQIHRLIVLNNAEEKRLRGVVSLGDISRAGKSDLATSALERITERAV